MTEQPECFTHRALGLNTTEKKLEPPSSHRSLGFFGTPRSLNSILPSFLCTDLPAPVLSATIFQVIFAAQQFEASYWDQVEEFGVDSR